MSVRNSFLTTGCNLPLSLIHFPVLLHRGQFVPSSMKTAIREAVMADSLTLDSEIYVLLQWPFDLMKQMNSMGSFSMVVQFIDL